jgi:hypothetical protein
VIVRAHRHAAGDADHVRRAERILERLARGFGAVTDGATGEDRRARARHQACKREGVGAVDAPGAEIVPRLGELVAGHQHRDPRPPRARQLIASYRCGDPELGGADQGARAQDQIAAAYVFTGTADVLSLF